MIPRTNLIIRKAREKFPVQTQLVELCECVMRELRPHFAEALRNKVLRQDEALGRMQEVIHDLLKWNCDSDSHRDELKNEVDGSKEWLRLAETIDDSRQAGFNSKPSTPGADLDTPVSENVTRAMLVERIRREIIAISQRTELQEDYDDNIRGGKGNFSSSLTVSVCDQHNDLCDKLCAIKTTPKPKIVDLACEIAARVNGKAKSVLPKTFLDAHKRHGAEARKRLDQRA